MPAWNMAFRFDPLYLCAFMAQSGTLVAINPVPMLTIA
jgi:hypothetical protein